MSLQFEKQVSHTTLLFRKQCYCSADSAQLFQDSCAHQNTHLINIVVVHSCQPVSQSVVVVAGAECILQGVPHATSKQAAHQGEAGSPGC